MFIIKFNTNAIVYNNQKEGIAFLEFFVCLAYLKELLIRYSQHFLYTVYLWKQRD